MTHADEDDSDAIAAAAREHNKLHILVQAAIQDVERTDLLAPLLIAPFAQYLLAHFHCEETELFLRVERVMGDPHFPQTASLRREHLVLREFLSDIEAALTRRDRAGAKGTLMELAAALHLHGDREDALYSKTLGLGENEKPKR